MSRYAIVKDNQVINVIVSNPHNAGKIAKSLEATSVYADRYPIQAGDTYQDNKFMRGEVEIKRIPTAEERVASLEQIIDAMLGIETVEEGGVE